MLEVIRYWNENPEIYFFVIPLILVTVVFVILLLVMAISAFMDRL